MLKGDGATDDFDCSVTYSFVSSRP